MTDWDPQLFLKEGEERGTDPQILNNALAIAENIKSKNKLLPPLFTLGHLAFLSGVSYGYLRGVVSRRQEHPYRSFQIRKRPGKRGETRLRTIVVPQGKLMEVQRWIAQALLSKVPVHPSSVAFSKGNTVVSAAQPHCQCRWLIKLDVKNFFESINEITVYRVFRSLGYQPIVAFELARLCTRCVVGSPFIGKKWRALASRSRFKIEEYSVKALGHLPQGAPSSPMLANLAMVEFDRELASISFNNGFVYTRYADDIAISTRDKSFGRERCQALIEEIFVLMGKWGLSPNRAKTRISSPGSRKIVLGLIVNGPRPNLTREFKDNLRRHTHFLSSSEVGPTKHAFARGFASTVGLKNHVVGLIAFAHQVDPEFAAARQAELSDVEWPEAGSMSDVKRTGRTRRIRRRRL